MVRLAAPRFAAPRFAAPRFAAPRFSCAPVYAVSDFRRRFLGRGLFRRRQFFFWRAFIAGENILRLFLGSFRLRRTFWVY